jgi:hypothetical protein
MITITLEIPDELATQLKIAPAALPSLIREAVANKFAKISPPDIESETRAPVYQEIIDFLTDGPTSDKLLAFKISDLSQQRLEELLDKNREEEMNAEEKAELRTYLRLSDYLTKLKARARAGQPLIG